MNITASRRRFSHMIVLAVVLAGFALSMSAIRKSYGDVTHRLAQPDLVASVEGHDISARVYEMYLKNGIESFGLIDAKPEGHRQIVQLKQGIINELIDRALIQAEAERRGLTIDADKFDSRYRQRIEEMGGEAACKAFLKDRNVTDDDFRQIVRSELYSELLQQELSKTVSVAPAEAEAFYNQEKANPKYASLFVAPEQVRASHILISARRRQIREELPAKGVIGQAQLDRLTDEEIQKRRAQAADILKQLQAGADFATLARSVSDDGATRERGGDLGWFARDAHTPKFDEAVFALQPGQLSQVVETEYGFHIIKSTEYHPQQTRRFDEVRAQIEQQLLTRKRAQQLTAWLQGRRRSASISINPSY